MQGTYGGGGMQGQGMRGGMTERRSWENVVQSWPKENQDQVRYFAEKYGQPQSVCDTMITWYNNGPWKRTVVYNDQMRHDFPQPHKDLVKQTIDYRVPTTKVCKLVEFDGSLVYDRTAGELSAHCGNEAMSYLGCNLANQLVMEQTDVQGARRKAADAIDTYMRGQQVPSIMQQLQFTVQHNTADPDVGMMAHAGTEAQSPMGGTYGGGMGGGY